MREIVKKRIAKRFKVIPEKFTRKKKKKTTIKKCKWGPRFRQHTKASVLKEVFNSVYTAENIPNVTEPQKFFFGTEDNKQILRILGRTRSYSPSKVKL